MHIFEAGKSSKLFDLMISMNFFPFPCIVMSFLYMSADLSHVFSSVRRDLNFIDHTSDLGWKE